MGVFALNATALDTVSDSFEAPDGSFGLPIAEYKLVVSGAQNEISNFVWFAQAGDASTIVSNDVAYGDIIGDGPITNDTAELILNLETEGNTLSRTAGVSIASNPAYVDTLIQFTPSEDDPVIDTSDVKVALYVNAQSNLVVIHNMYVDPPNDYTVIQTNSVIDSVGAIDPAKWYRLSMKVIYDSIGGDTGTEIYLDGTVITHPNALDTGTGTNGGSYFVNIDAKQVIELISFQGTGLLDELVVSDEAPNFGTPPQAILLTLYSADGKTTFSPVGPVDSGTEVTMTADDWYRIDSVTGPIDQDVSGLLPAASIVTTLTATASCTVTVETAVVTNTVTGIGGSSYDAYMVATWALANGVAEVDPLDAALEDDYLLNVAPGTDAGIKIDSITVAGTTVTIVVGNTDNTNVNFDNINGTLKLYSSTTVDGTYTEVGSASIGSGDDTVQIDITGVANPTDFFKAVIE